MASGVPYTLGPFDGGLNRLNPRVIENNELSECINFDILPDGVLGSRIGFSAPSDFPSSISSNYQGRKILGIDNENPTFLGIGFTIIAEFQQDPASLNRKVYTSEDGGVTWVEQIVSTFEYSKALRYADYMYYVSLTSSALSKRHNSYSVAPTTVTNMPYGVDALIHKDRMWIAQANKLYYSAPTDPTNWTGSTAGFLTVGNSEAITAIAIYNDAILIFKESVTYRFDFTSSPGSDGFIQLVNSEIGASVVPGNPSRWSVTTLNDVIYLLNRSSIYRYVNNRFEDIGVKLDVNYPAPWYFQSISAMKPDKIIVGCNDGVFRYFVYHTSVGAWSEYKIGYSGGQYKWTSENLARGESYIGSGASGTIDTDGYVFLSKVNRSVLRTSDYNEDSDREAPLTDVAIPLEITTKEIDGNDPIVWKKLYWFGFEVLIDAFADGTSVTSLLSMVSSFGNGDGTVAATTKTVPFTQHFFLKSNIRHTRFRTTRFKMVLTREAASSARIFVTLGRFVINAKQRLQKAV